MICTCFIVFLGIESVFTQVPPASGGGGGTDGRYPTACKNFPVNIPKHLQLNNPPIFSIQKPSKDQVNKLLAEFPPKTLSTKVLKDAKQFQAQSKDLMTKCYMDYVIAFLFA